MFPRKIRPAIKDDLSFIADSWIKGYGNFISNEHGINKTWAIFSQRCLADWIMGHSNIIIACNADVPGHIYGYLVYEIIKNYQLLHWAFVKKNFRHDGILRDLLAFVQDENPGTNKKMRTFSMGDNADIAMKKQLGIITYPGALNWFISGVNYEGIR